MCNCKSHNFMAHFTTHTARMSMRNSCFTRRLRHRRGTEDRVKRCCNLHHTCAVYPRRIRFEQTLPPQRIDDLLCCHNCSFNIGTLCVFAQSVLSNVHAPRRGLRAAFLGLHVGSLIGCGEHVWDPGTRGRRSAPASKKRVDSQVPRMKGMEDAVPDRARADAGRMRDAASRVSQTGREPTERGAGDSDPHCPRPRPRRCPGSGDRGRDSVKRNRMAQTGLLDRTACRTLMGAALAMLLAMPYVTPRSLLDRSGAVRHRYRRRATTSRPLSPSARGMSCPLASMTDALRVAVSSTARLTESGEIVSESDTWYTRTRTKAGSTSDELIWISFHGRHRGVAGRSRHGGPGDLLALLIQDARRQIDGVSLRSQFLWVRLFSDDLYLHSSTRVSQSRPLLNVPFWAVYAF